MLSQQAVPAERLWTHLVGGVLLLPDAGLVVLEEGGTCILEAKTRSAWCFSGAAHHTDDGAAAG